MQYLIARTSILAGFAARLSLLMTALIGFAPSHAVEYENLKSGWSIDKYENKCTASASYQEDEMFFISYYPKDDVVFLTIYHPYATSLMDGETINLYIKFVVGKSVDNDWGSHEFNVGVADDGGRFLMSSFAARDMLRDIARAEMIAFTIDESSDRIVTVFNLSETVTMVKVLRECSLAAAGLNPKDPFVG